MNGPRTDAGVHPQAPDRQVRRLGLRGVSGPVGRARDFTGRALAEWAWADSRAEDPDEVERAEDVLLVVSELVANAMTHGGGVLELVVTLDGDAVVVGATDGEGRAPTLPTPGDPARPGGHGLQVVRRLATSWGTTPQPTGKTVWARFDR
ncbi:ATP-binding protein [Streptacidiphilus jiangxiensis]|uniref:Histidine kinase-like ATPase domain-containing protein n=1 Tax=Streptacidiphilus jiangxiensis TaxID=235985 RepID=A0A1H7N5C2_STRJI|nr:ATP-binding protein [Streptacidiphilus jiangxiensis]SEL18218.1 Histidine kinase-like ATPase domain-containing protein [Streptacidiphilus jiangxiensis]